MEHFTVSVYFRVSGQGSTLFGDGFALWLTDSNRYREGGLHGFTDTFTGAYTPRAACGGSDWDDQVCTASSRPHLFGCTHTGIGIVFDTFKNLESGHIHKDVAVIVNDGSGPVKLDDGVEPQGCDGDFRYHEGRDDFNVQSRSAAAITLNVRVACALRRSCGVAVCNAGMSACTAVPSSRRTC